MSNEVTEQYFEYSQQADARFLSRIRQKIDFTPEREIFRGRIYDQGKVGSLIYKGENQGRPAVLKIQILRPAVEEIDIIERFNRQNRSERIKLPEVYDSAKWNKDDGCGYLLLEYVDGEPIYQPPLADEEEIEEFARFYEEYKTKAVGQPLFPPSGDEQSSLALTERRVNHWARIAEDKKQLTDETKDYLEKYFKIIERHLPKVKTEFMHGHLTYDDIFKTKQGKYVLMSNLFWLYRPETYDTTFNIWSGIKSVRDFEVSEKEIIAYVERWQKQYKKLAIFKDDPDFEKKFMLMMLERSIGALLIDLENQNYQDNKEAHLKHLRGIFKKLFNYCVERIG